MRINRLTIPASDPTALSEWYGSLFGVDPTVDCQTASDPTSTVQLGESTLALTAVEAPSPVHVAVRLSCEPDDAVGWLADEATILPVEGQHSRYFEFLDATAIYFDDPAGNVLEGLCYNRDRRPATADRNERVDGITEIGLPTPDPLALVEWLEKTVGLSAWGSPSETFAWVGDSNARFVVVPADRPWYPTARPAGITPISATVSAESACAGRHSHPTLPYEIGVK